MSDGPATGPAAAASPSPAALARWRRTQDIFAAALELSPPERAALVARECGEDPELRREVESLLDSHERDGALDRLSRDVLSPAVAGVRAGPSSAAGRTVGHYLVGERHGGGGMGVVHRARDERLGRAVALKFLPPHLGTNLEAKRRFLLEARAAAALEHPNICTIHEIGETPEGELFIAMPFYEGETLQARLSRGPLRLEEAVAVARGIALGLDAAHQRGIVHRDVKPSNVMLLPDGRVKILDFGIAKVADAAITGPGAPIGTAAYMSPEQATGDTVDPRTDVWSLGVVLYEMIAGRRPFAADTASGVLFAILSSEPEPLTEVRPDVWPALAEVVRRAMAKIPSRRFVSMAEVIAALDGISPGAAQLGDIGAAVAAAERRHVAVVATTMTGYAALVEELAPAALETVMARLRAEAVDVARRHGGIVNHAAGEQIVTLFGIPASHEDDELRAVRAAMELTARARDIALPRSSRAGLAMAVQSGIGSGSVVVQRLREGPRRYHLSGDAVATATRLASIAAPGTVSVSPECHRTVSPFFKSEPEAPTDVRPGAAPVSPYRIIAERAVHDRLETIEQTDLTPYTGRTAELSRLQGIVDSARAGEGRLVTIVGEAGMGKSRLLLELRRHVANTAMRVLTGRCQSYAALSPYLPFVQMLSDAFGIDAGHRPSGDEVAARIVALDASLSPFVPLYLHLLSLESRRIALPRQLQGEHLHAALLDAVTAIVMTLARRAPLLLLLEDWHWTDEASRAVVGRLAEIVQSCAMALVVTSRPEGTGLGELGARAEVIRLEPLDSDGSAAIMRAVFRTREVGADLVSRVHERTGGNPFFLEQIAHTLLEEGAIRTAQQTAVLHRDLDTLRLPETVEAVIRARLDRLEPDTLEVLRVASVIGREFSRTLLVFALDSAIDVDGALDRLRASGLVQQMHVVPDRGYRFKHVLTQEVAYGSLLEHQRRRLHGVIGAALERNHPARPDDPAELLAHHFSRAEEWPDAVRHGRRAVDRLRALSQYGDAVTLLERVQQWVPHLPDDQARRDLTADLLLDQERLYETLGQRGRQQEIIGNLVALLAPHGTSPRLTETYLRQGDLLTLLKRFDAADRALATALRLSRERQDEALERHGVRSLGLLRWHEGRHEEALALAERALAIDRGRGDDVAIAGDLSNIGNILISLGQHERARAVLEDALAMPVLETEPARLQYVLHNLANVERAMGDLDRAVEYLQRAIGLVPMGLLPIQQSFHLTSLANVRLEQGRIDDAVETYELAVALSRRARHAVGLAQALSALGELEAGLGHDTAGVAHLSEAAGLFGQLEDRDAEARACGVVAALHERQRDWREAERAWATARELAMSLGNRRDELAAVEGLARASRRMGGPRPAVVARFEEALAIAVALGDQERETSLRNTLGILAWEDGAYATALAHYEAALRSCRITGNAANHGLILNSIGVTLSRLGRDEEARTVLEESVACNQESGERLLEAHALAALGDVSLKLGRLTEARDRFDRARTLRCALGDTAGEGVLDRRLAEVGAAMSRQKG